MDLERYPRPLDQDLALLDRLNVDHVLIPKVTDLYPDGYQFRIQADSLTTEMEGAHRPGFLQGVMTVVLKLLNLVRADRAYFGEKDYQQLRTIAAMADAFFIPTQIVPCPTLREPSGLAESSRNALLSTPGRAKAACIFSALTTAPGPQQAKAILEAEGFQVDYVEERWGRRLAAAFLEGVRLIDNVPVGRE
jgi:pantoate--beta-alanine ligase